MVRAYIGIDWSCLFSPQSSGSCRTSSPQPRKVQAFFKNIRTISGTFNHGQMGLRAFEIFLWLGTPQRANMGMHCSQEREGWKDSSEWVRVSQISWEVQLSPPDPYLQLYAVRQSLTPCLQVRASTPLARRGDTLTSKKGVTKDAGQDAGHPFMCFLTDGKCVIYTE